MNIHSISFTDPPVFHQFPPIYENLGLPELSSFIEQRFEFVYSLGKLERTGYGSIRLYKQQGDYNVIIHERLPGIGPKRLEKLKSLLIEQVKMHFIENINSQGQRRTVYHTDFRVITKDAD